MSQLPAIEALVKACEEQRPIFGVPGLVIDAARAELETYRRLSRVLRRLNA